MGEEQKVVRNSLLSAAATTSLWEDTALLVPVTLGPAEDQGPQLQPPSVSSPPGHPGGHSHLLSGMEDALAEIDLGDEVGSSTTFTPLSTEFQGSSLPHTSSIFPEGPVSSIFFSATATPPPPVGSNAPPRALFQGPPPQTSNRLSEGTVPSTLFSATGPPPAGGSGIATKFTPSPALFQGPPPHATSRLSEGPVPSTLFSATGPPPVGSSVATTRFTPSPALYQGPPPNTGSKLTEGPVPSTLFSATGPPPVGSSAISTFTPSPALFQGPPPNTSSKLSEGPVPSTLFSSIGKPPVENSPVAIFTPSPAPAEFTGPPPYTSSKFPEGPAPSTLFSTPPVGCSPVGIFTPSPVPAQFQGPPPHTSSSFSTGPIPATLFSATGPPPVGSSPVATFTPSPAQFQGPPPYTSNKFSEGPFSSIGTPPADSPDMYKSASSLLAAQSAAAAAIYQPPKFHWFFRRDSDGKAMWKPFSLNDSAALEQKFVAGGSGIVATDGGRYDTDVFKRVKVPVYWESETTGEVRRCSWFYKGPMDSRFMPYDEALAEKLESEYQDAFQTNMWNRRIDYPGGEAIIFYSESAIFHFCQAAAPDEWGNIPPSQLRPRVVRREVDEGEIEEGEPSQIDHLVLLVHGIGAICDFKFRTIVEAVDDFRSLSGQLMQSHFKEAVDSKRAGRVEFLPISWHNALHGDGGIDTKLKRITLGSIPKLRQFTNDTLLDILFYTSPVYAQTIMNTVGSELNRIYQLFLTRNPDFSGKVAVSGHSLGSLILFDLLAHQPQPTANSADAEQAKDDDPEQATKKLETSLDRSRSDDSSPLMISYAVGTGTGQPFVQYPKLNFSPTAFYALGSPIGMFVTVRGIDTLGKKFHFPTCPAFFNIFHPYDPVAYRIEKLIDPNFEQRPVLIPHHKGRKRLHLELKETMQRVGADLKQKVIQSLRSTWSALSSTFYRTDTQALDQEIQKAIDGELNANNPIDSTFAGEDDPDTETEHGAELGMLNGGKRIDFVLQEAPLESFNEYLFALTSHVCYWESEDTMLMILKQIYSSLGISTSVESNLQLDSLPQSHPLTPNNSFMQSPMSSAPSYDQSSIKSTYGIPLLPTSPNGHYPTSAVDTNLYPTEPTSNVVPLLMSPTVTNSVLSPPPPMFNSGGIANLGRPAVIGRPGSQRPVVGIDAMTTRGMGMGMGMDPTAPIVSNTAVVGPPPLSGFQRK